MKKMQNSKLTREQKERLFKQSGAFFFTCHFCGKIGINIKRHKCKEKDEFYEGEENALGDEWWKD